MGDSSAVRGGGSKDNPKMALARTPPENRAGAGYVAPDFAGWAHTVVDPPGGGGSTGGAIILGPRQAASGNSLIRSCLIGSGVTAVVNCTLDVPCHHEDVAEYCRVPVRDEFGADVLPYLWGAAAFVDAHVSGRRRRERFGSSKDAEPLVEGEGGGGSVLVHCEMGVSRSTTVVLAYLIRYRGMSLREALRTVRERRPQANPNPGFMGQLEIFEADSVKLRGSGAGPSPSPSPSLVGAFPRAGDFDARMEWAKRSSAIYSTMGSYISPSDERKAAFTGGEGGSCGLVFGYLCSQPLDASSEQAIIESALDYVWLRGVLLVDLRWLKALCLALENIKRNATSAVPGPSEDQKIAMHAESIQMIRALIGGDISDFRDRWSGEIYPEQVQRIIGVLSET